MKLVMIDPKGFMSPSWTTYKLASPINTNADFCFGAEINGMLVGFIYVFYVVHDSGDYIEIASLEVHPTYKRNGIASCLLEEVFHVFGSMDYELDCNPGSTDAQWLYKKYGFVLLYNGGQNWFTTPRLIKSSDPALIMFRVPEGVTKERTGWVWDGLGFKAA